MVSQGWSPKDVLSSHCAWQRVCSCVLGALIPDRAQVFLMVGGHYIAQLCQVRQLLYGAVPQVCDKSVA